MKKEEVIGGILTVVIISAIIYGVFKLEQYKFRDCKKVGHGTFYCVLNVGK